ncbi:MAG: hypothetical protein AVDCRST_MAG58-2540, partial [uncultured Rubrobacteraceae bacterium]
CLWSTLGTPSQEYYLRMLLSSTRRPRARRSFTGTIG